jgi:5-methylcytosine-specific restriction protein A
MKPLKPCKHPGCPELTGGSYCDRHNGLSINKRQSAEERGYNSRWRTARKRFLNSNPLCVYCLKDNKVVKATVVDHIIPHRGDKILFWDVSNWQALCKRCHDRKTRTQDQCQKYRF